MIRSRLVLVLVVVIAASAVGCRAGDRGARTADTTPAPVASAAVAPPTVVPPAASSPTVAPQPSPAGTPVAPAATPVAPAATPAPVALPDLAELERMLEEIDDHLAEASAAGLEEGSN